MSLGLIPQRQGEAPRAIETAAMCSETPAAAPPQAGFGCVHVAEWRRQDCFQDEDAVRIGVAILRRSIRMSNRPSKGSIQWGANEAWKTRRGQEAP